MNDNTTFNLGSIMTSKRVVFWGIVLAAIVTVFSIWGYANSLWNAGVDKETALNAQYMDNQNDLSSYVSGFYEGVGIANLKSAKLDQILTDAVKGRYEGHTSANVGQGQLFSAIKEAYPNLDLGIYDKMLDYIKAGRAKYAGKQSQLLYMLRDYDKWRGTGIVQQWLISWRYPSHLLKACIGGVCQHGEDAEDKMWQIVVASAVNKAYDSGVMDPLTVPKN
jgi:hypothetical protein